MNKIKGILAVGFMFFALIWFVGCKDTATNYTGNITEVKGNSLTVLVFEGEPKGYVTVHITKNTRMDEGIKDKLIEEKQITFTTNGTIAESYPPQVTAISIDSVMEGVVERGTVVQKGDTYFTIDKGDGLDPTTVNISEETIFENCAFEDLKAGDKVKVDTTGNSIMIYPPQIGALRVAREGTGDTAEKDSLKDLAFIYKDKTISISDIVEDEYLENIIGEATEKKTHTYSKDDGRNMDQLIGMTEKQYYFPGLVIKSIGSKDNKFSIFNIKITDPKYPTKRNIKVGDSLEKLIEAYPEGNLLGGDNASNDEFRYNPIDYVEGISFNIKGKKVDSILMYKLLD